MVGRKYLVWEGPSAVTIGVDRGRTGVADHACVLFRGQN